ncbi:ferritin-like domain-containing protein [Azospirillum halopraeferens]|uniref:ferritin-like domain-containing protein n=1 Tax=Azospirillum halopraeferens TaxID=34010 RepID=UPI00042A7B3B|nr:ferritin family protein [Azospirillum halopraeferens]
MRRLLDHEPDTALETVDELLAFAMAMEEEAVRRYTQLAELMERRGDGRTAAVFRAMCEEERDHVAGVAAWAHRLNRPRPAGGAFVWRLPPEIAASWEELTGSVTVTPYRALALAVLNEMRAFACYGYIAARAARPDVRARAGELAAEELGHAERLRRERRRAFHRCRTAPRPLPPLPPADLTALCAAAEGPDALRAALARCEAVAESLEAEAERATDEAALLEAQRRLAEVVGLMTALSDRLTRG